LTSLPGFPLLYPNAGVVDPRSYAYGVMQDLNPVWWDGTKINLPPAFGWGSRIQGTQGVGALPGPPNQVYPGFLTIFTADGRGIVHEIYPPRDTPTPPVADREYFIEAMRTRRTAISDVIVGRLSHVPIVTIAVPILAAAGFDGVAGGSLDLSKFEHHRPAVENRPSMRSNIAAMVLLGLLVFIATEDFSRLEQSNLCFDKSECRN